MTELQRLIADLKRLPDEVNRDFRGALRRAAEPIVADAKNRASWSERIPGAIGTRTRVSGQGVTVSVRVNAKKAPHARPIENRGRQGNFRHPVHADPNKGRSEWTWVPQRARPFLRPAAEANADEAGRRMMNAVESAIRRNGWR